MERKDYIQYLSDTDRVHVLFVQDHGKVIQFSVNYSAYIGDRWREIFRVDNCHGSPHTHRYYVQRRQFRVELGEDNNQAFTEAKKYIVVNFVKIKENYLRVRRGNKKRK